MARILLLEDDKRARETFVDAFKLMGHESVACAGVRDAIAEYDGNGRVDIIVSDLNLENTRDKGGFRFFEHVDGKDPWQAFIMMTGNPELLSDEEKKKLAGHGAVLLGKPFGFEDMQRAIGDLLAKRPLQDARARGSSSEVLDI